MSHIRLVNDNWVEIEFEGLRLVGNQWVEGVTFFDPTLEGSGVISDEIVRALGSGHINDLLSTHFGRTATESLQDAEYWFLVAAGATPCDFASMWVELYGSANEQDVESAKLAYWVNQ